MHFANKGDGKPPHPHSDHPQIEIYFTHFTHFFISNLAPLAIKKKKICEDIFPSIKMPWTGPCLLQDENNLSEAAVVAVTCSSQLNLNSALAAQPGLTTLVDTGVR